MDITRSITSYCIFIGEFLASWKTKTQSTMSKSSIEVEYMALGAIVDELRRLSHILKDFKVDTLGPIPVYCNNDIAICMVGVQLM